MKIKHKESGKVIEVMDGTIFAKSAYDVVGAKSADTSKEETAGDKVVKDTKKTATKTLAKTATKADAKKAVKKPAAKPAKTEVTTPPVEK